MKNPFKGFFMKRRKGKTAGSEKEYLLCCDFGYDITSPIPSVEPVHKNSHCVVPAVVGTVVKLFPKERVEVAEFVSGITDEDGQTIGLKCRIRTDPEITGFFGIPEDPAWEVDLICEKVVFADYNRYENGKNTHNYRRLLLTEKLEGMDADESMI